MKTGPTTTILHSDLESPIEHFPVHKPMHVAAAYGYPDATRPGARVRRRDAGSSFALRPNGDTS